MTISVDLSEPATQIAAAVVFLVPGLIATWVIERLVGRGSLSGLERLLRALAFSLLVYALASPWLLSVGTRVAGDRAVSPWEAIGGMTGLLFIAPLTLGVAWAKARRAEWTGKWLRRLTSIHSAPTAWDFTFGTPRPPLFIRARLKNGRYVGGFFGGKSFASSYPEPQEIFLEQAWRMRQDGSLQGPIPGSRGLLLRRDDVDTLELLSARGEQDGKRESG